MKLVIFIIVVSAVIIVDKTIPEFPAIGVGCALCYILGKRDIEN